MFEMHTPDTPEIGGELRQCVTLAVSEAMKAEFALAIPQLRSAVHDELQGIFSERSKQPFCSSLGKPGSVRFSVAPARPEAQRGSTLSQILPSRLPHVLAQAPILVTPAPPPSRQLVVVDVEHDPGSSKARAWDDEGKPISHTSGRAMLRRCQPSLEMGGDDYGPDVSCHISLRSIIKSRRGSVATPNRTARLLTAFPSDGARTTRAEMDIWYMMRMRALNWGTSFAIFLNGIFIGLQTNYMASSSSEVVPAFYRICEILFGCFFFTELGIRIYAYRRTFFSMPSWRWNVFDVILVLMQFVEVASMIFTDYENASNLPDTSWMRVLRILRLLRILRVVRLMQFVAELNVIISSVIASMKSLCWTMLLLVLMLYIVAVFFTQIFGTYRLGVYSQEVTQESIDMLAPHWGSLVRSISSLYMAILGGIDWIDVALPLADEISPFLAFLFALYITFAMLAMMNVITGVFVEAAMKRSEVDRDTDFLRAACDVFNRSDKNQSGDICFDEFSCALADPHFKSYMMNYGIDPADALTLFALLDKDNIGIIEFEALLEGMLRLRAGANFIDMQKLVHLIEVQNRRWSEWASRLEEQVGGISSSVRDLTGSPAGTPKATPAGSSSPPTWRVSEVSTG